MLLLIAMRTFVITPHRDRRKSQTSVIGVKPNYHHHQTIGYCPRPINWRNSQCSINTNMSDLAVCNQERSSEVHWGHMQVKKHNSWPATIVLAQLFPVNPRRKSSIDITRVNEEYRHMCIAPRKRNLLTSFSFLASHNINRFPCAVVDCNYTTPWWKCHGTLTYVRSCMAKIIFLSCNMLALTVIRAFASKVFCRGIIMIYF